MVTVKDADFNMGMMLGKDFLKICYNSVSSVMVLGWCYNVSA